MNTRPIMYAVALIALVVISTTPLDRAQAILWAGRKMNKAGLRMESFAFDMNRKHAL